MRRSTTSDQASHPLFRDLGPGKGSDGYQWRSGGPPLPPLRRHRFPAQFVLDSGPNFPAIYRRGQRLFVGYTGVRCQTAGPPRDGSDPRRQPPVEPPHRAPRCTFPAPRHNRQGTIGGAFFAPPRRAVGRQPASRGDASIAPRIARTGGPYADYNRAPAMIAWTAVRALIWAARSMSAISIYSSGM